MPDTLFSRRPSNPGMLRRRSRHRSPLAALLAAAFLAAPGASSGPTRPAPRSAQRSRVATGAPATAPPPATSARSSPPPTPRAPSRPVANLDVVRTFANPPPAPASYLRGAGERFVGFAYGDVVVYSPERSRPVATWSNPPASPQAVEYTTITLDDAWLRLHHAELFLRDEFTGAPRWHTPLFPGVALDPRTIDTAAFLGEAVRAGPTLVATVSEFRTAHRGELLGLDWSTGAVLWREPTNESLLGLAAVGARAYLVHGASTLRALDAATGRVLWQHPIAPLDLAHADLPAVLASPRHLVVARPARGLEEVDPATGATVRTVAVPGRIDTVLHRPRLAEDTLYLVVTRRPARGATPGVRAHAVVAVDLAAGRVAWQSDEVAIAADGDDAAENAAPLVVDADSVYACFQDGALRVYDRAAGRTQFTTGLRGACELAVLAPDAEGAARIVVRTHDGAMALLARRATPTAAEHARLVGRVRLPGGAPWSSRPVLVDGAVAMTDALGRFDARAEQRRVVVVRVPVELAGNQSTVALDGRATAYTVDLQLAVPPPLD